VRGREKNLGRPEAQEEIGKRGAPNTPLKYATPERGRKEFHYAKSIAGEKKRGLEDNQGEKVSKKERNPK